MKLNELFSQAQLGLECDPNIEITGVTDDSRKVLPGYLFVAYEGSRESGVNYARQAMASGAVAVLAPVAAPEGIDADQWFFVENPRQVIGALAHTFVGNPSESITVAGVTGTNGKTTTAWLIESIFRAARKKTALLGTLFYRIGDEERPAPNTTASACRNAELFAEMRDQGVQAAAMEVSSHAIDQNRIAGIQFDVGLLTNISQDHLDYHLTMENYAEAKWRFFEQTILPSDAVVVFNIDDSYGREFSNRYPSRQIRFSQSGDADVRLIQAHLGLHGIEMRLEAQGHLLDLRSRLLGRFNVENILAAVSAAVGLGINTEAIAEGIQRANGVPGRFERIEEGQPFLVAVDYACTPDALERALANAREMTSGRIITVFGCGGDRDQSKRPLMGLAVGRRADRIILSTDNPRSEEPADIARMAEEGLIKAGAVGKYEIVLDRREAIERAIRLAEEGDLVLIEGKGHETYQEVQGIKHHFDDREVAREVLRAIIKPKGAAR